MSTTCSGTASATSCSSTWPSGCGGRCGPRTPWPGSAGGGSVARLGGDEFVVLLEGLPLEETLNVTQRLLTTLGRPFGLADRELCVGASAGVAFGAAGASAATVLRNADLALYAAKDAGRGRHAV